MPKDMKGVMGEYKRGQLHSGSSKGEVVTSRKQAIAIGLSEQRQQGKAVTPKPKRRTVAKAPGQQVQHAGKVTSVNEHGDGQHVEIQVLHGRKPDNSKPNTPYKESKTSRVLVPKAMAKHFPVGGAVHIGISPGQPARTNDAAPKPGTRTASAKGKGGSAIRAAFGK